MGFTTHEASEEILYVKKGKFFAIQLTTDEDELVIYPTQKTVNIEVWMYSIYVTNEGVESFMLLNLMTCLKS